MLFCVLWKRKIRKNRGVLSNKSEVDRLSTLLMSRGYLVKGLHGDMEQRQRSSVMQSFQSGTSTILVATDVAARGLDVRAVSHVVNFHIPLNQKVMFIVLVERHEQEKKEKQSPW